MLNWGVFGVELRGFWCWTEGCVELRGFCCWTEGFWVWNWEILRAENELPFCVELMCWTEGELSVYSSKTRESLAESFMKKMALSFIFYRWQYLVERLQLEPWILVIFEGNFFGNVLVIILLYIQGEEAYLWCINQTSTEFLKLARFDFSRHNQGQTAAKSNIDFTVASPTRKNFSTRIFFDFQIVL